MLPAPSPKPAPAGKANPIATHVTHDCSSSLLLENTCPQLPANGLSCHHFLSAKGGVYNLLISYWSIPRTGERWKPPEILAYSQNVSICPSTLPTFHPSTHPLTSYPFSHMHPPACLSPLSPPVPPICLPFTPTFTLAPTRPPNHPPSPSSIQPVVAEHLLCVLHCARIQG